jgi:hypothetical protein
MSKSEGKCPNCGAPIAFTWSGAVQTVCAFCRSIVVRHDLDLTKVGEVSDLPEDSSPIQVGTSGKIDGVEFSVTGRIIYEYDQGGWNEWHLACAGGASAWLSDAMAEYAVTRLVDFPVERVPSQADITTGYTVEIEGASYQVTTSTMARYRGVEGELPFEYWDKDRVLFVDLRTTDGRLATIDYSETPALVFAGRFCEYPELHLSNVRRFEGWPI